VDSNGGQPSSPAAAPAPAPADQVQDSQAGGSAQSPPSSSSSSSGDGSSAAQQRLKVLQQLSRPSRPGPALQRPAVRPTFPPSSNGQTK
jgi:hypothetical protein